MRTLCSFPILASLLVSSALLAAPPDSAAKPASMPAASPTRTSSCNLSGLAHPDLDLPLLNGSGQTVARFGGAPINLTLSAFPEDASGRMYLATSGSGRLRVSGYVHAKSFPLFLKNDVPVAGSYIFLTRGSRVEFAGSSGDKIQVTLKTSSPLAEIYTVNLPCDGVTLSPNERTDLPSAPIAGQARGYYMSSATAPLFDAPGTRATPVTTIHLASDARGILFFGDKREGDFIHVLYRHDVRIDGWMSVKDLALLPKGELVDQRSHKPADSQASKLTVSSDAKLYRASRELALYGKADPKQEPIGLVPAGTELYVLDVVVGWANVLPKQLDIVPLNEKRFWVRASELGI